MSRSFKVCVLTSVHQAKDVRIFEREARSLVSGGYDVTIVAPHVSDELVSSIRIRALPRVPGRLHRFTSTVWEAYRAACSECANVYHFHDPELIPIALLLKLRGKRVVYDVHEDVPRDIMMKAWILPILRRPAAMGAAAVHFISAIAFDRVIAATPVIAARFPGGKAVVIQNFPWLESSNGVAPKPYSRRESLLAYVGGISRERGVLEMVRALALLDAAPGARLVLAGEFDGSELKAELGRTRGFERVDHRGWLSRDAVSALLGTVRAGLVLFHPFQSHVEAQPNKLFEYMAAGLPVIASDFPLWRTIVEDAGCGLLVDPLDPAKIANAIEWILCHPDEAEEMGRRGLAAVRSKYNWNQESQKLLSLYSGLVDRSFVGEAPRRMEASE